MNLKKYYDEIRKKEDELTETRTILERQTTEYHDLRGICTHNIVFKFNDNSPRERQIDGKYFCPACRLLIECARKEQLQTTKFRASRVIPILNLSLRSGKNIQDAIRNEVYENLDLYYNPDVPQSKLSDMMEKSIVEHHFDYLSSEKLLINRKKN